MPVEIIECTQGEPEWFQARLGIPTASMFGTVIAKGRGGGESKTRRTYMLKLIGERMTREQQDSYSNHHMERGQIMEEEARDAYVFITDNEVTTVGFVRNGDMGASPDSLVRDDGLLEIKTKLPHLQIEVLLADQLPPAHTAQVQGQIMVCEREWCDFVSYWPKLPVFIKRVYRDEAYIARLTKEISLFNEEMAELEEKIREMQ